MSYAETETGCTQQYLTKTLPNSNPNIKKRIPQHQNTNSMYPKSMKRIATHNREVAKIGRTQQFNLLLQSQNFLKEYRHDSLVYYKPRVPSSSCDARTQQLQAPYHPFNNISRPLFRTTYKAITSFSPDATMLTGPKPCFPSEGTERREALQLISSSPAAGCRHRTGTRHMQGHTCLGAAPGRRSRILRRMVCHSTCSSCCRSHPQTGDREGNGCKGRKLKMTAQKHGDIPFTTVGQA